MAALRIDGLRVPQTRSIAAEAVNIIIRSYHELKALTDGLPEGGRLTMADGETVGAVLRRLAVPPEAFPEMVLFINGRPATPATRLAEGDTLVFFSSVAGG